MIERSLSKKIMLMTKSFPVITLTGPRQSGKTTLVRWLFPDYEYINLENLNDLYAVQEDPLRFLKVFSSTGVIIDEAQKFPELFSYLQGIVDESKQMGKFILTGSQNFLLLEKITQSLAGRVAVFHLMPFGLCELEQAGFIQENLDKILFTGSYPVLYDRNIQPQDYLVPNAFFWRDNTGHEIDLLLEEGENLKAVEIKSGETINSDFFKGLNYFGNLTRLSKENLFLIYDGQKNYTRTAAKVLSWKNYREIAKP